MTVHSLVFLGGGESISPHIDALEASPICGKMVRSGDMSLPQDLADDIDLILFEAGPRIAQSGQTLQFLIHELADYPLVAVTTRENEHRGIAAVRAGARSEERRVGKECRSRWSPDH